MRVPQPLSYARAKNANPRVVEEFFDRLSALYARLELSASQIYNADETGISCVHKPSKVCAKRGQKAVWSITAAEKGRTNTILASGSASGHALPPMIIFPRQRVSLDLMSGAPADTLFTGTTLGWINSVVFFKWFKFFVSQIPPKRPVLLLYDGHASHISTDVIEYAHLHHIEIMCLPAHSSHLLQPLDVAVFKPLKTHFNEACRKFLQSNPGRVITIYDISQLVGEAWPQALTPVNLISGFSNSGIYPLNPAKITLEKLAPSQLTNPMAGAQPKKSIDDILVVPQPTQKSSTATLRRKPGLAISGRCITEAEFRKEMREREAELLEIERQKQEKKAAKEKKKKEREAEKERKKKEKEAEKERRLQERTVKRGRGQNTKQKYTKMIVDSEELDGSGDEYEEYYCGECGTRYEEDGQLWIGCDGGCEGWYHVICVGIDEENLPEDFYCDKCSH